jgi:hypothetical protein
MALLVFAVVLALVAVAKLGLVGIRRRAQRRTPDRVEPPVIPFWPPATVEPIANCAPDGDAEREEVRLAARLAAGELAREQYRLRMADLAARDAQRNPMVVPPIGGDWPAPG